MFILDPGSDFFPSRIPDPNCLHPGSRILIKEFMYFNPQTNPKKLFLSSKKYDPGCSSRIPDPDSDFLPIPDPGSRIQGSKRHPILDPDPQHWHKHVVFFIWSILLGMSGWELLQILCVTCHMAPSCSITSQRRGRWYFTSFGYKSLRYLGFIFLRGAPAEVFHANQQGF